LSDKNQEIKNLELKIKGLEEKELHAENRQKYYSSRL